MRLAQSSWRKERFSQALSPQATRSSSIRRTIISSFPFCASILRIGRLGSNFGAGVSAHIRSALGDGVQSSALQWGETK